MNCPEARGRLPLLLYGDLTPAEAAPVEAHLAGCPACRRESDALAQVRLLLDQAPVPEEPVDLPALYRRAAERQRRRLRRWRWAAVTGFAAAAAVLLLALGLNLEVRLEPHQVVVRWGRPPDPPAQTPREAPQPAPVAVRPEPRPAVDLRDQVQVLSELVQALADDVEARDRGHQEQLARLQARLDEWRRQTTQRWMDTERDVAALAGTRWPQPQKGTLP
jgi:anti-sigma factor RsiW